MPSQALDDFWLQLFLQASLGLITVAAAWGAAKAKLSSVIERLDTLETKADNFVEKYVSRQEFLQAMVDLKAQHREMRDDIRKILEILSKRGRS